MADKEQYHLSEPAEWIDKVIAGAVIGTEPMPELSNQFKAQFRENIGAADATAKWQPLGFFDTVEELEATITNPAPGDAYAVGVEEPFNIWVWDGVNQRWRNGGNMKGMDGKDGEDGSDANVTKENIIAALGYTPADAENVGVPDGSIGTAQLANGAVTAEKLDPDIDLGGAPVLLWENANPLSSFPAQKIIMDFNGGNNVLVEFRTYATLEVVGYIMGKVGKDMSLFDIYSSTEFVYRSLKVRTDGIDVSGVYGATQDTQYLIPTAIYLLKGVT